LLDLPDGAQLWERTLSSAFELLSPDGGSIWLAEGGTLRCHAAGGDDAASAEQTSLPLQALDRLSLPVDGATVAAAPISVDGEVRAVVRVQRSLAGAPPFAEADRECLAALAESAAAALRIAERERTTAARASAACW
jgi:hypothetical protein